MQSKFQYFTKVIIAENLMNVCK